MTANQLLRTKGTIIMFTVLQESRLQAEANLLEREVIHSVDSWITMILILTIYIFSTVFSYQVCPIFLRPFNSRLSVNAVSCSIVSILNGL